ncbi:hypothetical protein ACJIZ3_012806 [Penstemon smallii]|uniref:Wax synthase domain-containing protein n=1 Tax=Penstemon smallii TaxID=265156 RepID=A0ABD3UN37_9LAMI
MDREIIEAEIRNFIMVWSSILISACYCYIITKFVPKGTIRFFTFLPVLCLFLILPLKLNFINLVCPTSFFISWLASFKLLLLVFEHGPLSNPSLSVFDFVLLCCLPIMLKKPASPNSSSTIKEEKRLHKFVIDVYFAMRPLLHFAEKGLVLISLIVFLTYYKDIFPREIVIFLVCICLYIAMDVIQGVIAVICQVLLQTELEPAFNYPYHSTSLKDFWSHRWNRVAGITLRSTVFEPIFRYSYMALGQKWASILAVVGTFLVSALMHEIMFYYLCGVVRPARGTTLFFFIHGLLLIVESKLKRKIEGKWQTIVGPLIFGFVIWTFIWLCMWELLLEYDLVNRGLEEYAAVVAFAWDLGMDWRNVAYNLCKIFIPTAQSW